MCPTICMATICIKPTAIFDDIWSYRPQDKSIWSKIWPGSWFWRPFRRSSSKSTPNWQKTKIFVRNFRRKKFFGVEKSNVRNRLKRVLAKFRADPSQVWRENGRWLWYRCSDTTLINVWVYKSHESHLFVFNFLGRLYKRSHILHQGRDQNNQTNAKYNKNGTYARTYVRTYVHSFVCSFVRAL